MMIDKRAYSKRLSSKQRAHVRKLLREGQGYETIALAVGRTKNQVSHEAERSGISVRRVRKKISNATPEALAKAISSEERRDLAWYKEQLAKAHMLLLENGILELEVEL
jgi:IS30 family transposase